MQGAVHSIFIAKTANAGLIELQSAELKENQGIVGDRYYNGTGTFSEMLAGKSFKDLTLIEIEEIHQFNQRTGLNIAAKNFRRNIITQDIRLNDLVGKHFLIGDIKLHGIKLCEPCAHLAEVLSPEVLPDMMGKCGLRAQILSTGSIYKDDIIRENR